MYAWIHWNLYLNFGLDSYLDLYLNSYLNLHYVCSCDIQFLATALCAPIVCGVSDAYMAHAYIDGGIQVVAPALGAPICLCCIGSDYTY